MVTVLSIAVYILLLFIMITLFQIKTVLARTANNLEKLTERFKVVTRDGHPPVTEIPMEDYYAHEQDE